MKRFFASIVLVVVVAATSALGAEDWDEDWGFGIRVGLTFGMLQAENAPTLNTPGYGASIGIILGYPLSKHFGFVSGLDMTTMGLGYYNNNIDEEVSIRNGLLSVPLTIRFQIDESFPLYLAFGGQLDFPFYPKAAIGDKGYAIKDRAFADIGLSAGIGYAFEDALNVDLKYVYNLNPAFDEKARGGAGKNSLHCVWAGFSIAVGLFKDDAATAEKNARLKAEADAREARVRAMQARDAERMARVNANPTGFGYTPQPEPRARAESRSETEQVLLERGMIVLDAVYFETGKAEIHRNSKPYLTTIAKMLVKYPKLRLEIGGHTDNVGSLQSNMTLSQQRADRVSVFMRSVEPSLSDMLSAKGYGPTEPKADNNTAEGRETNRRVELKVLNPEVLAEYK